MSIQLGLSPGIEMSDKDWRKYNKFEYTLRSVLWSQSSREARMSLRRTVCLATALVAFMLGLSVGIAIPVYVVPSYSAVTERTPVPRILNHTLPARTVEKRGDSVSFVGELPSLSTRAPRSESRGGNGIVDGVFWSEEVEAALPTGFGEPEAERWRRFVRTTPVVKVEEGCGRMQNRLLTFAGGVKACCRYRQNTDQIQGELFSFYLGRLLGLNNLAPSSLAVVRSKERVWAKVKPQISLAQWAEDRAVVLTRYIERLEAARIPGSLRNTSRRLHPPDVEGDKEALVELAQWSDLIVFDYLTANLDRIVNNLYNLQWNPGMMEAPAHNLAKQADSKLLVFLDNESGLLHGYRLLDKYESYHSVLLDALCVFRRSTVEMIDTLRRENSVGKRLNGNLMEYDDKEVIPGLPEKSVKILNDRLNRVHDQVAWCKKQYSDYDLVR
jgi:four-jointed box protein 1